MSFRRRQQRWLRRLALAFALAAASLAGAVAPAFAKLDEGGVPGERAAAIVRPDDRAGRFALSDVPSRPEPAAGGEWTFERGDALMLVIGGSVLALGLGLALGSRSRPRVAGL